MVNRIRELRQARGWALGELAARARVYVAFLSTVERYGGPVGPERRRRISQALEVPEDEVWPNLERATA